MEIRRKSGFTLIELLLVLVILSVLAAVVVPKFTNRSKQSKIAATKASIATIAMAIDSFEVDCGRFPNDLKELMVQPMDTPGWNKPYLSKPVNADPWGRPFVFRQPGAINPDGFDLYSAGPDGQEGNDDDICSWNL